MSLTEISDSIAQGKVLAISGGVGGAKLSLGLMRILQPEQLTVVANTGDDFEHLGLSISPDLDTVMYTLGGVSNRQQGWGLEGESWQVMKALEQIDGDTWFQLGDKDIATHLCRTQMLQQGHSLSDATDQLCKSLNIETRLIPMTDQPVRTMVQTENGQLAFQHYFVREQCKPTVTGIDYMGAETAAPHPDFLSLLEDENLKAVVICPSNPFLSIAPMLTMPGVVDALRESSAPVIAVSPIVGGTAIKGPAAKMMAELGMPVTTDQVARYYAESFGRFLDGFVIDNCDQSLADSAAQYASIYTTNTVMNTLEDRETLAREVLELACQLSGRSNG